MAPSIPTLANFIVMVLGSQVTITPAFFEQLGRYVAYHSGYSTITGKREEMQPTIQVTAILNIREFGEQLKTASVD